MFFVGIDVSSAKHDCCILDSSRKPIRSFMILNNRKGFSGLSAVLTELAAPENIKIGLESTGIYGDNLANFLRRKGYNVCTINPLLCKKHQSATTLRKTKNDRSDAKNIALIVASEDLQPDQPLSYHIVELKSLSRARFLTVKDRSSLKNKVKRFVTVLFPELLDAFTDLFGASGMVLMTRYPSAKALAACNLDTLTELLRTASRGRFGREKASRLPAHVHPRAVDVEINRTKGAPHQEGKDKKHACGKNHPHARLRYVQIAVEVVGTMQPLCRLLV